MAGKLASRVRGLSEAQFRAAYGTEERCRAVVEELRWPEGFVCPSCGGTEGKWLSTRPKIQCRACRHQVSLTAGTILHATKLPLTSWFLAMWLVATAKNGISSVELGRRLGIKQTNAWALKQKIMAVMTAREGAEQLDGRVEVDDAYLGGHRPGRRGRGAAGKQPFVAAVSTSDDRRPRKIKLLPVEGFRKREVERLVSEHLASASRLVTDGLGCWTAAAEAGLEHTAMVAGGGKRAAGWSPFRWVNDSPVGLAGAAGVPPSGGRAMPAPLPIRTDRSAAELRALARREHDGRVCGRLLALAHALDGMSRTEAARLAGMDAQTLRDWVRRYNAEGPAGLRDRPRSGRPPRLDAGRQATLKGLVLRGPDVDRDGCAAWRARDLCRLAERHFGVRYGENGMLRLLHGLDLSWQKARPIHPEADPRAQERFKKACPA